MGKYHVDEDRLGQDFTFQGCIANELAEANRIKRLELRMRIAENDEIKYVFSETIDELEDLA